MELNQRPAALSSLIGARVRDSDGRSLGRVFELRAYRDGDGFLVIDRVLLGRRALWRRLRGPSGPAGGIPWEAVITIEDGVLTVAV
jgi:sporulation protein YlmC with PRC-barrel domain